MLLAVVIRLLTRIPTMSGWSKIEEEKGGSESPRYLRYSPRGNPYRNLVSSEERLEAAEGEEPVDHLSDE